MELAWPLVGLLFAAAFWDVGRRWVTGRDQADAAIAATFGAKLDAHTETHDKAIANLIKQVQAEIDSMSAEVSANVNYTRRKHNEPEAKAPEPWQQRQLDTRSALRKRTMKTV